MPHRRFALPAVLLCLATPSYAQQQPAPPLTIACSGPFAKDSSHARLQQAFGAPNVATEKVDGAAGQTLEASVVYRSAPDKRLEVTWNDDKKRKGLFSVTVKTPSAWTGPKGIHVGMTLDEVVRLNGQPFRLDGFESLFGGQVIDLQGKLAILPGDCALTLRFSPGMTLDPKRHAGLIGEKKLSSSDAKLLAVKPVLTEWSVEYGE